MGMLRSVGLCITAGLLATASAAFGQVACSSVGCIGDPSTMPTPQPTTQRNSTPPPPRIMIGNTDSPFDASVERDQAKARNNERQKQLEADTQKLLALATELKADVEKSNKDTLSLDVVRKADEIEKLAKSVRDKMKGS